MERKTASPATSSAHALAEKHLEDIVWVHATHSATLLDLLYVLTTIVSLLLLRVRQNSISFSDVFKHSFRFFYFFL
jgi:hypothetical protein